MKKIIMVAVMVALFASAVGVGVHVMHKEARAWTNHVVWTYHWNDLLDVWEPAAACVVVFTIQTGPDPDDPDDRETFQRMTDANGKASCAEDANTTATFWTAEITDAQGLNLQVWDQNPKDVAYPETSVCFWFE